MQSIKNRLKTLKQDLHKFNKLIAHGGPPASFSGEEETDGEVLLLGRSVSRYRPPQHDLKRWAKQALKQNTVSLSTKCIITLRCPKQRRPIKTFHNPTRKVARHRANDGLPLSVIVALAHNKYPKHDWDQVSHLCGHGRCINPDHLLWETPSANIDRNLCHHYNQPCQHTPRCLLQHPEETRALTRYFRTK